jgi:hypothetical protein
VRVAEDDVFAQDETEQEAEHGLGDAVALGLVELRDLGEPQPVDVLRDEHASGPEIGVHARHPNVRVVPDQPRNAGPVLRIDVADELIGDPLAHLAQAALRRRNPAPGAGRSGSQPRSGAIVGDLVSDLRVLNVHRDELAVASLRAVNLAMGAIANGWSRRRCSARSGSCALTLRASTGASWRC